MFSGKLFQELTTLFSPLSIRYLSLIAPRYIHYLSLPWPPERERPHALPALALPPSLPFPFFPSIFMALWRFREE